MFRKLIVKWRAKQRQADIDFLWPACCWEAARRCQGVDAARIAFSVHAANDRAWQALDVVDYERIISTLPGAGPFSSIGGSHA